MCSTPSRTRRYLTWLADQWALQPSSEPANSSPSRWTSPGLYDHWPDMGDTGLKTATGTRIGVTFHKSGALRSLRCSESRSVETVEHGVLARLDSVVISHRDADHARGLGSLLAHTSLEPARWSPRERSACVCPTRSPDR